MKKKEKRHVCVICGKKRNESKMVILGYCHTCNPVWICNDANYFKSPCWYRKRKDVINATSRLSDVKYPEYFDILS